MPPRTGSLAIEAEIMALNPHVKFVELDSHGVSVLDVTPEEVRMDWYYASTGRPERHVTKAHSWRTRHDTAQVEPVLLNDEGAFIPLSSDRSALHPEIRPGRPGPCGP